MTTCPGGCGSPIEPDGLMCRPCLLGALTIERIALERTREKLEVAVWFAKGISVLAGHDSSHAGLFLDVAKKAAELAAAKYAAPTEETE